MGLKDRITLLLLFKMLLSCAQLGTVDDRGSFLAAGDDCGKDGPLGPEVYCATQDSISINDIQQFTVVVPPDAGYNLVIQLASLVGDADLVVIAPPTWKDDKNYTVSFSSSERLGDDTISLPEAILKTHPGNYTIQVIGWQRFSMYRLNLQSPSITVQLHDQEVALLASIYSKCCVATDDRLPERCLQLQRATAANRTAAEDLCSQPPNVCNADGRLVKLVLSSKDDGNLACNIGSDTTGGGTGQHGGGFPQEFGSFKALQALDLSKNRLIGQLSDVAAILGQLPSLRRLFLNGNTFSGPIDCDLITPSLEVLWLGDNLLSGPIPACVFNKSLTLQQLSLSKNLLTGPIPDVPTGSQIQYIDLSANGAPDGPGINAPGLSGSVPASLSKATGLLYLDVSSNSLSGTLPDLPLSLEVLIASDNSLSGSLPASLTLARELRTLAASRNSLTGRIPFDLSRAQALGTLQLASNKLEGGINYVWVNPYLTEFDVSNNSLTGDLPSRLAKMEHLQFLNLAGNRFSSGLAAFAKELRAGGNALVSLNISGNSLGGTLPDYLKNLALFSAPIDELKGGADTDGGAGTQQARSYGLDVSNNKLSTDFPTWLLATLASLYPTSSFATTSPPFNLTLNGGANVVRCPTHLTAPQTLPSYVAAIELLFNLSCEDRSTNNLIRLSAALAPAAGIAPPGGSTGTNPSSTPPPGSTTGGTATPAAGDGSKKKKSNVGPIVGAVVGVVGGVIIIGLVVWWLRTRGVTRRSSYHSRRVPLTFNQAFEQGNGNGSDLGGGEGAGVWGAAGDTAAGGGGAGSTTLSGRWSDGGTSAASGRPMIRSHNRQVYRNHQGAAAGSTAGDVRGGVDKVGGYNGSEAPSMHGSAVVDGPSPLQAALAARDREYGLSSTVGSVAGSMAGGGFGLAGGRGRGARGDGGAVMFTTNPMYNPAAGPHRL